MMKIYKIEYRYEDYYFGSVEELLKALHSWWVADGRPWWFTEGWYRSHFPTKSEVLDALSSPEGFYRDFGDDGNHYYVRITVHELYKEGIGNE